MNSDHAALCSSPEWARYIAEEVLPHALGHLSLGTEVLEIGPGYGASTAELVESVPSLTAVEVDARLAAELAAKFPAVSVVHGSGDRLPFGAESFSAVVCFTMLHHMQSVTAQEELFAEVRRVLRPGGVFAGADSVATPALVEFHGDDTYVPVDPDVLPERLTACGLTDVDVHIGPDGKRILFSARSAST
jgi:ubiquinone/menaquinone biosynthesis C-methylase UbiE